VTVVASSHADEHVNEREAGDKMAGRAFDVVIFGATGFTGKLASEHLTRRLAGDASLRWERFALAGRNREKLVAVRKRLEEISPRAKELQLLVGDGNSEEFLETMCKKTNVVLTYVGPYLKYSLPLARACVKYGTDYCDITGEAPYQVKIVEELHEEAKSKGVTLITSCGYDSIPFDVGTYGLVKHLRTKQKGGKIAIQTCTGPARGSASGGTIASAESFVGGPPLSPHCLDTQFLSSDVVEGKLPFNVGNFHNRSKSWLCPSIMEGVNQKVIYRSRGLMQDLYGVDFTWQQFTAVKTKFQLFAAKALMGVITFVLSNSFAKGLLLRTGVLPKPGEGPSEEILQSGFFNEFIYGSVGEYEAAVHVKGRRGDPGYKLTSAMSLHTALMLSQKDSLKGELNMLGGVLTPAACMGDLLWRKMPDVDVTFELKENTSSLPIFDNKSN